MKSTKNKTIDFDLSKGEKYLNKCLIDENITECRENATIIGDTFSVLTKIKDNSVDLLIVDPPYNLNKNFHGEKFKKGSLEEYTEYTEKWITAVKPKLKNTASIYVCCDWQSAMVIASVLLKHFIVRNRITWGREKGRGATKNWKNRINKKLFLVISRFRVAKETEL